MLTSWKIISIPFKKKHAFFGIYTHETATSYRACIRVNVATYCLNICITNEYTKKKKNSFDFLHFTQASKEHCYTDTDVVTLISPLPPLDKYCNSILFHICSHSVIWVQNVVWRRTLRESSTSITNRTNTGQWQKWWPMLWSVLFKEPYRTEWDITQHKKCFRKCIA